MTQNRNDLWKDLIYNVNQTTSDMTEIIMDRAIRIGLYDDVKESEDLGLAHTCNMLLEHISDLYVRVLEIRIQGAFINKENKNETK